MDKVPLVHGKDITMMKTETVLEVLLYFQKNFSQ